MFLRKILQLRKFDGADFKYDNIFAKITAHKYTNHTFLVSNLDIFVFFVKFAIRQISGCWFQIWQQFFFKFQPKNMQIRHFGPKFKDFYFAPNLAIGQIWGCWFQIWQWLFRILAPKKTPNKAFFVINVSIF